MYDVCYVLHAAVRAFWWRGQSRTHTPLGPRGLSNQTDSSVGGHLKSVDVLNFLSLWWALCNCSSLNKGHSNHLRRVLQQQERQRKNVYRFWGRAIL